MAKEKAYFWRGKGELSIQGEGLFVTGEKIPHDKLDKGTFALLKKSGDIKETDFDVVESSTTVSALEKKVKSLSEDLAKANAKVSKLEAELEEATSPPEEKKD